MCVYSAVELSTHITEVQEGALEQAPFLFCSTKNFDRNLRLRTPIPDRSPGLDFLNIVQPQVKIQPINDPAARASCGVKVLYLSGVPELILLPRVVDSHRFSGRLLLLL